jgi:uncharacterized protein (TIGR01777 family)
MRVLVTGGTGFIGELLCPRLAASGHEVVVLTRQSRPDLPRGVETSATSLEELDAGSFGAAINLAGASIADGRWTESRKRVLWQSRVETTAKLVAWMCSTSRPSRALISGSAVGYYGDHGESVITEDTVPEPGFAHDLCAAWEGEAGKAADCGIRVCYVRTGVVLDGEGGALEKMLPAFRLGVGGRLGSGKQYFPWVHREDIAAVFHWLLDRDDASGAYNASAPHPATNAEFTAALGRALGRPAVLPMPAVAMRVLFGRMADELLLSSERMVPGRLLEAGFEFRYPRLPEALQAILG